ncbi:hypothetical protein NDU88_003167 [Pleurodeles waltl]|uniref:Uncharacterized protein n=1 Tax=Pleurodeles waltl TaxID=8319 RepID=A0AAV7KU34_PLEWA|nr:hypothetical protein NDU88_003167 [Pleurodeles waltl]
MPPAFLPVVILGAVGCMEVYFMMCPIRRRSQNGGREGRLTRELRLGLAGNILQGAPGAAPGTYRSGGQARAIGARRRDRSAP